MDFTLAHCLMMTMVEFVQKLCTNFGFPSFGNYPRGWLPNVTSLVKTSATGCDVKAML
jgi:hypothetical protein